MEHGVHKFFTGMEESFSKITRPTWLGGGGGAGGGSGPSRQAPMPPPVVHTKQTRPTPTPSGEDDATMRHHCAALERLVEMGLSPQAAKVAVRHLDSWLVSEDGRSEMAVAEAEATNVGEPILHVHDQVRLEGLVKNKGTNGMIGTLEAYGADSHRWKVRLTDDQVFWIKPKLLRPLKMQRMPLPLPDPSPPEHTTGEDEQAGSESGGAAVIFLGVDGGGHASSSGSNASTRLELDGQIHEIRYGPGQDFESPQDFFAPCRRALREPCETLLQVLEELGGLEGLPLDPTGTLFVALPFCGSSQELPILANFLSTRCLGKRGVAKISILASDVQDWSELGGYWRQKEKYVKRWYERMDLKFCQLDLQGIRHPASSLTFAFHPECTVHRDVWRRILYNVITASTGLCVVGTFNDEEMKVVVGVCQELGRRVQCQRNPYYAVPKPGGTTPPFLNYLILVR
ncbi:unnamed protein product [Symbiodinium natans]|uniref:Uncharacterized protein n=1 Tax=Symbiodinium natans TaxID=878477 RepID=A0A812IDX0_9DINO|nr:unnamed protein product [Symbiodinium natans]